MKTFFLNLFLLILLVFALVVDAISQSDRCKVTDPTETPLNVRASPNGKILRTIKNGANIYVEQTTSDEKNRSWVQISQAIGNERKILGWVFGEFINCDSKVTSQAETLKTVKGYFCGFSEGDGGYPSIRVGNVERTFAMYGDEPEVKFVNFKTERDKGLWKLPVGSEMIVSYVFKKPELGGDATNIVRKLTLTGKVNRKTKSCGFGL